MTSSWLGWLAMLWPMLWTTAHAAPLSPPKPPAARAAPPAAPGKRVATAVRPSPPPDIDSRHLKGLTDDAELGDADRVDGDEAKGVVAFTFDDGPNPETTPAVIDALQKYDVPATFFIITQRIAGKHGERSREILQRVLDAGFLVGSHTVSHASLRRAATGALAREVDASITALAANTGRPIGLFRAPYGALNAAGRGRLKKLRLTEVHWSVDTLDWKAKSPERLRKKVLSMIKKDGGGVVLMHDVKPITAKILADVLDDLEAENCARLADQREPIVPVSLHYFLKNGKSARQVPEAVKRRTDAYRAGLADRCARRLAPMAPTAPATEPASDHAIRHAK